MFCQSCGAELPDGARFCPQCGQNCSVQLEVPSKNSFSFDDELSPIEKPTKTKTQTKATKSKSESTKKKAVEASHEKASIVGSTEWRYWHESGSNNSLNPGTDFSLYLNLKSLNSDVQQFLATVAATIEPIYAQ